MAADFLDPNIAFARNERFSCSVSIGKSHDTRDVLETAVVVHTNLKKKVNNKVKQNSRHTNPPYLLLSEGLVY